ncbi:restriction endonuclease subunit S [Novosphingobium sp. RL4]|uniref:restriction endonuclease subunit S n=1 Tax=Novosphingobium sp. RL4 TaxID=3109595 RepID=UPI002D7697F3|nr:restriction endonuclease subunit S [Novosphingobium sp. RL4]WRT94055.1 restriction endonuclease subunit S [Novosphingobium sp. RL4]
MKQDALAHLFAKIGDAPECVARLRQIVVALAITGKLGLVDSTSNPSDILAKVEEVKTKLAALRAIPKPKKLAPVTEEDLPASFQDASCFASLGTVARIEKGLTGIKDAPSGPFPLVVTAAERGNCDHFDFEGAAAIIPLVSSTGHGHASINRLHYQDGKFALGSILAAVLPYDPAQVSARFLFEYLSAFKDELLVARMTGSANVTLSIGRIAEVPVPLVCPAVQRTVDELMALCDRLEEARKEREAARDRMTAASLARLNAPVPDLATFTTHARFALDNLPALTTRADQIKQLRQTILNLAVRGKLVEQDKAHEPASLLLRDILSEPWVKQRENVHLPDLADDSDCPFSLPTGWVWASVESLVRPNETVTYGILKPVWVEHGIPTVRVTEMKTGYISVECLPKCDPQRAKKFGKTSLIPGDLLISKDGTIGKTAFVPPELAGGNITQHVLRFPITSLVDRHFVRLAIDAPFCQSWMAGETKGVALQGVNVGDFRRMPIPLPPLAEQRRIVAKANELMALCGRLEASLATGDETRQRLLEAILHEALEPAEARELELA